MNIYENKTNREYCPNSYIQLKGEEKVIKCFLLSNQEIGLCTFVNEDDYKPCPVYVKNRDELKIELKKVGTRA